MNFTHKGDRIEIRTSGQGLRVFGVWVEFVGRGFSWWVFGGLGDGDGVVEL